MKNSLLNYINKVFDQAKEQPINELLNDVLNIDLPTKVFKTGSKNILKEKKSR